MNVGNVVIVGMGNIGRRHLQGLAAAGWQGPVSVLDLDPHAPSVLSVFGKQEQLSLSNVLWAASWGELLNSIGRTTFVIVATPADGRGTLLKGLIAAGPLAILSEKPVTIELEEYDELLSMAEQHQVPVYVNFGRHCFEVYQGLRDIIANQSQIVFHTIFGEVGLISSGIHMMDLALWLLRAECWRLVDASVQSVFDSKRPGYQDCYGHLRVHINDRSMATIQALPKAPFRVDITAGGKNYSIYETEGRMLTTDSLGSLWEVTKIEAPLTSQITASELKALQSGTRLRWCTLQEARGTHELLRQFLRKTGLESMRVT